MARLHTVYVCSECGASHPKWLGRCGTCGAWSALVEDVEEVVSAAAQVQRATKVRAVALIQVSTEESAPVRTGAGELDRVLGGGLVPGSVTLLGGEPGIGKSTLTLQVLMARARRGATCLLVTAEESAAQVRLRADRVGTLPPNLHLLATTHLPDVLAAIDELSPELVVIDSVQTVVNPDLGPTPGTVSQVRGVAATLVPLAKSRGVAIILVGHVTKEGTLAGPRLLEHAVDTVLSFEGDRHHALRMLRAVKHRFGATGELGLFEMGEQGLRGLPDPSGLFLGDRVTNVPGSVVVPVLEGQRPLLVEVQALVAASSLPNPRRTAHALDGNRLSLLLAVLERRCGIKLGDHDVHAAAVGGVRVTEAAVDLGVALAIASSALDQALPPDVVAIGEIGLAGELRQVGNTPRRLTEAARLGFKRAIVPQSAPAAPEGISLIRAGDLPTALAELGLVGTVEPAWRPPRRERQGRGDGDGDMVGP